MRQLGITSRIGTGGGLGSQSREDTDAAGDATRSRLLKIVRREGLAARRVAVGAHLEGCGLYGVPERAEMV